MHECVAYIGLEVRRVDADLKDDSQPDQDRAFDFEIYAWRAEEVQALLRCRDEGGAGAGCGCCIDRDECCVPTACPSESAACLEDGWIEQRQTRPPQPA